MSLRRLTEHDSSGSPHLQHLTDYDTWLFVPPSLQPLACEAPGYDMPSSEGCSKSLSTL